jgi:putative Ca2+/H+ antiporter (TMEM165/GDT1 family)
MLVCSEWGDRSQIAAIALAPNYMTSSLILGGCGGMTLCILLAVALGKVIEKIMTERLITLIGGCMFIGFGIWELFFGIIYADYF